jgi:hypothetical protein
MRHPLRYSFWCLLILLGCGKPSMPSPHVGAKDGNALKVTFMDARLVVLGRKDNLTSVGEILSAMQEEHHLAFAEPFGLSNLFLNPDINIWKDVVLSNHQHASSLALVIRVEPKKYSAVFFDGRLDATLVPPADWCK